MAITSPSLDLDEIFQELDSRVKQSATPVSYRWLSMHLQTPANLSKRILFEFYSRNNADLEAIYFVSGRANDNPHSLFAELVQQDRLEELKKTAEVDSIHVHSLRKKHKQGNEEKEKQSATKIDLSVYYDTLAALDGAQQREFYLRRLKQLETQDKKANCFSLNWCSIVSNSKIQESQVKISFQKEGVEPKRPRKHGGKKITSTSKGNSNSAKKAANPSSEKPKTNVQLESKRNSSNSISQPKISKGASATGTRLAMMFKAASSKPKKSKQQMDDKESDADNVVCDEDETNLIEDEIQTESDIMEDVKPKKKRRKSKSKKKQDHAEDDATITRKRGKNRKRKVIEESDEESDEDDYAGPSIEELEMQEEVDAINARHAACIAEEKERKQRELEEENLSEEEDPEAQNFKSYFKKNASKRKVCKKVTKSHMDENGYLGCQFIVQVTVEVDEEEEIEIPGLQDKDKKAADDANSPNTSTLEIGEKASGGSAKGSGGSGTRSKKSKNTKKAKKSRLSIEDSNSSEIQKTNATKSKTEASNKDQEDGKKKKKVKTMLSFFQRK
eukprot:jgi/Bigna1/83759/fgenesh1_pg.114_\